MPATADMSTSVSSRSRRSARSRRPTAVSASSRSVAMIGRLPYQQRTLLTGSAASIVLLEVVTVTDVPGDRSLDVVVIGGGAAGLNGALMLARSRRSVLVIDSEAPRNAPAEGVHGLLGRDGMSPVELLERGREQVRQYGGRVVNGEVASAEPAAPSVDGD